MEIQDREELARFAREHHVHYDVEPDTAGRQREVVGYEVRLFAVHAEPKLEAPACPRCVELLRELRSFAERLVSPGAAEWTEFVPEAAPALYESKEVSGGDEVALTFRVHGAPPGRRAARRAAGGDPHLEEIRGRLKAVGVPQR